MKEVGPVGPEAAEPHLDNASPWRGIPITGQPRPVITATHRLGNRRGSSSRSWPPAFAVISSPGTSASMSGLVVDHPAEPVVHDKENHRAHDRNQQTP